MRRTLAIVVSLVAVTALAQEQPRILPLPALRSGTSFLSPELQAMQEDDAANPGLLWVSRGEQVWNATAGASGQSCASCHGDARSAMRGVAARHPAYDKGAGAVVDLEARIARCRTQQQGAPGLPRESEDLLALTAYVTWQSRGLPLAVSIDGPARDAFERGRTF
jgi:sulfur-oxidizing protein SoxA